MSKIKFNRAMKKKFLEAYADKGIMAYAARQVNISTTTVKMHLEADPWFKKHFDEACEIAADVLEEEAHRRAVDGYFEPIFNKDGVHCGDKPVYSDKLLSKLLDAARPEKFNTNKTTIEHKGKVEHIHVDQAKQTLLEKLGQMALPDKNKEPIDITPKIKKSVNATIINDDLGDI